MKAPFLLSASIASALLCAASAGRADPVGPVSCRDAGATFEQASSARSEYAFSSPAHVVEAAGIAWLGIEGDALSLLGSEQGCWTDGLADGPYDDRSVYECTPTHCPVGGCPVPCLAYHTTACMAPESSGGQVIEGFECAHYGDGISREVESGDLVIRRAHLRNLNDDAIEDDYGLSNTRVFDSLIDGVHISFGDRQRSSQDNDATGTEWEVRESLIRVRANANPYKRRPGHGGFWKADHNALHQHRYRVTNNVFVAQGLKQGGLLFPVMGYVDECAGNILLWAGPITGSGGWEASLADQSDFADGLAEGARLAALNAAFPGCYRVVLKPEAQTEAEFLATPLPELGGRSWHQLVADWGGANAAPSVAITAPAHGATVTEGEAVSLAASASDPEDGDVSAAILWSSSLAGPLGSGASLTLTDLWIGAHLVTASVTDSGGRSSSASVALTVADPNAAPSIEITAPADGTTVAPGATVDFTASASDEEDGELSETILWSSSLEGSLGSGASFSRADLGVGTHAVTASVTDLGGRSSSASVTLTVQSPNAAPGISITAPASGTTVNAGTAVAFAASASDTEDGDLSAAIAWSSSLAGPLGSGASLTLASLAAGTHVVTASVTDSGGRSSSASVTLTVNAIPVVTISSPQSNLTVALGVPIAFAASASDAEDGDLSATVVWTSNKEGVLGTGATLTKALRVKGTHTITASVTDSRGALGRAQIQVRVRR
jgi:hypothetical protein